MPQLTDDSCVLGHPLMLSMHDEIFQSILPCPNASGELHMGHALNIILQDIFSRWHQLQGKQVLWFGAIDSGGFSTQSVVESQPPKHPSQPKHERIKQWIQSITPKIYEQMISFHTIMDVSCQRSMAAIEYEESLGRFFIQLFESGVIHYKQGSVSWCSTCQTSISPQDELRVTSQSKQCRHCHTTLEMSTKPQWYLSLRPLAAPVLEQLAANKIQIYPKKYQQAARLWLQSIALGSHETYQQSPNDQLCLSQQIECGLSIPAYFCDCGAMEVSATPVSCTTCKSPMVETTDTFNLNFCDMFWPYYVNQVYGEGLEQQKLIAAQTLMVTGLDLLYSWVLPVALLHSVVAEPLPFKESLIHPLLCDEKGEKMSKSIGNVMSPDQLILENGVDAFRLSLLDHPSFETRTLRYGSSKIHCYQKQLEDLKALYLQSLNEISKNSQQVIFNEWILFQEEYDRLGFTFQSCDVVNFYPLLCQVIEKATAILNEQSNHQRQGVCESLRLLFPFVPKLVEELWTAFFPTQPILLEAS